MTPATITHLRSQGAEACSSHTKGQDPTEVLWVVLGRQHDPMVRHYVDQVRVWFYLLHHSWEHSLTMISRLWWKVKV